MKKLSTVISWPDGFDFPIFRSRLPQLLNHVDEVIICFNPHGIYSLRDWLKQNMSGVRFLDVEKASYPGDWRNKSTKYMIDNASGEYILSLEQDFLIKDYQHFFNTVYKGLNNADIVMFQENNERGGRFHPAFLLCKKEYLNSPGIDFSVMGQGMDHFALVTKQLKNYKYDSLQNLGLEEGKDWLHIQGLTDNYFAPRPYFDLPTFHVYNEVCKEVLPMSEYWMSEMNRCAVNAGQETKHIGDFV